ncbi:putative membrane-associated kinase regulator 4 [Senna tora]|uniref:Putative membrane-associated kinase regulator 4 n=1 Tax=Senna tora TaxID=362788 RepID=A0A834TJX0_9FABA|nr:putative membrane-associated kinase regulator 4 [Senna tora]
MASSKLEVEGEDYIDMEVSSYSHNFFCNNSQPAREFEFQMSSISEDRSESMNIASPADELFYKGKLLPLHLPPRLQMVEKLLQNSTSPKHQRAFQSDEQENDDFEFDDFFGTPLGVTANPTPITTAGNTPFESCHVSRELSAEEYGLELGLDCAGENQNKKSWAKKLLKKKSSIGLTLKASRAYLKSLFGKSGGCSYENYYSASTKVADEGSVSKAARECLNSYNNNNRQVKAGKKVAFGQIQRTYKEKSRNEDGSNSSNRHRRSFSVGLKLLSGNYNKSSTQLTTSFHHLKRCSSVNSERENSIQGAIAHCKNSQNNASDVFVPRISVCEDQDRSELCRG